jgi:hypothetical protein
MHIVCVYVFSLDFGPKGCHTFEKIQNLCEIER